MRNDIRKRRNKLLGLMLIKRKEKNEEITSEILNIELNGLENDNDKLDINCEISSETRDRFMQTFHTTYLRAKKTMEPKLKAEIKLHVKEKQPFYFAPVRSSYEEKNRLREVIDDLLARKIIRPGNSEYASRIVLVKKKNGKTRLCVDYLSNT